MSTRRSLSLAVRLIRCFEAHGSRLSNISSLPSSGFKTLCGCPSEMLVPRLLEKRVISHGSSRNVFQHCQTSVTTLQRAGRQKAGLQSPRLLQQKDGHSNHMRVTTRTFRDSRGYQHFDRKGVVVFGVPTSRSLLIWGGALGGVTTIVWLSSRQQVPYTHRWHSIMISVASERHLGEQSFAMVKSEAAAQGTLLPPHHRAVQKVRDVGLRVAKQATELVDGGGFTEHMKGLEWEFAVIQSNMVNASVMPGGKVLVYTGLLRMMETEDELAAVLAHEAAHVVARHLGERLTREQWMGLLKMSAYYILGFPLPSALLGVALFLPHSRMQETEADVIGLQLAARACYDPAAAAVMFRKLGEKEKETGVDSLPGWLRTHPLTEKRARKVEEELPQARMTYHKADCGVPRDFISRFH